MPRYDYECDTCHHLFELKQSFDSEPVATCPNCQNGARRKFRVVPIVFKGSGFYVNDYGSRSNSTDSSAESKKSADADTGSAKTSDSTPSKAESKTETKTTSGSAKEKGD